MQTLKNGQLPGDITIEMVGNKFVFRQYDISLDTGEEITTYFEATLALLQDIKYELNITEQMRIIRETERRKLLTTKISPGNLDTTDTTTSSKDIRPENEKRPAWNSWSESELNKKGKWRRS